jgi:catechol 2,3-dioxygenase-like lactoylglutathione lyase family enzyme
VTGAGALPAAIAGLGQIMQLAFVPADIEAATAFWTGTMGVGPFFVLPHIRLDRLRYRGAPADIDFSIRVAYWGDMQIELVEQHNNAASIFREPAAQHGLHHVCMVVDDMAPARARCAAAGLAVVQEGRVPGGGEAIYVDTGGGPGTMVEMLLATPGGTAFFAFVRQAARDWDGSAPVRAIG